MRLYFLTPYLIGSISNTIFISTNWLVVLMGLNEMPWRKGEEQVKEKNSQHSLHSNKIFASFFWSLSQRKTEKRARASYPKEGIKQRHRKSLEQGDVPDGRHRLASKMNGQAISALPNYPSVDMVSFCSVLEHKMLSVEWVLNSTFTTPFLQKLPFIRKIGRPTLSPSVHISTN